MDSPPAVVLGIGLAASCGFRIFVPLLVASGAAHAGYLDVAAGFDWLVTWPATVALAVAAAIEISAFYIPWIDNILDALASPAAVVAGALLFAAVAVELDPFLKWTLAIIAGGGSAAVVQGGTVLTRLASTGTTGGFTNFIISTIETIAGISFSFLAIVLPVVALVLLIVFVAATYITARRLLRSVRGSAEQT